MCMLFNYYYSYFVVVLFYYVIVLVHIFINLAPLIYYI